MSHPLFKFSDQITAIPVIYGSGDFAVEVRRIMLTETFDCLAVPLPPSFKKGLEQALETLPAITLVVQIEPRGFEMSEEAPGSVNYVPVDPCQPVVSAIRTAIGERIPRAYIDLEVEHFEAYAAGFPDPYALKKLPLEKFVAALLPSIGRLPDGQPQERVARMARRLVELEKKYKSILLVCSLLDWPWIRESYNKLTGRHGPYKKSSGASTTEGRRQKDEPNPAPPTPGSERSDDPGPTQDSALRTQHSPTTNYQPPTTNAPSPVPDPADDETETPVIVQPDLKQLLFCLGELPFITALYEQARIELDDDENLSVDGVKDLLIAARDRYKDDFRQNARPITPKILALLLKYIRNLSLVERRLTPDLYTLVIAAQQFAGDAFALHVAETARFYPYDHRTEHPQVALGIDQIRLPDGSIANAVNRLSGPPLAWRTLELKKRPDRQQQKLWQMRWNPFRQCSWPPEDVAIERFRTHTFEKAMQIIGQDLARVEKFTTSVQDGIDIRETLRNWHTGDIFVKIFPPNRGSVDCVVMLFDSPADPRDYPYRITWHHEHSEESTLAFYATDYRNNVIGPGIAQATYGGCMMIFPPIEPHIPDIWRDKMFDAADTMEERLLMAACWYSRERHIALLSSAPPGAAWRKIARTFGKKLVHLPMTHFSGQTLQQLRIVHVLNGHQVRSYAAEFIRKA